MIIYENIIFEDRIQVEYSWTDHRVYRHRFPINDFYSHGYPLGFWAGPHAEELLISYQFTIGKYAIDINYSNAKRGELTEQMIIDQYATIYYERFSGIVEEKSILKFQMERQLYDKIGVTIGLSIIDWENAGFDPELMDQNDLVNIKLLLI